MKSAIIQRLLTVSDRVSSSGGWVTPLRECLEGVTAEEAAWKPGPEERSIWEIVNHVIIWMEWVVHFLRGRDFEVTEWPPVTETGAAAWAGTRERLERALDDFRAGIEGSDPAGLFQAPVPQVTDTDRFLGTSSILVHNAYHAGQIVKLRERWAGGG